MPFEEVEQQIERMVSWYRLFLDSGQGPIVKGRKRKRERIKNIIRGRTHFYQETRENAWKHDLEFYKFWYNCISLRKI